MTSIISMQQLAIKHSISYFMREETCEKLQYNCEYVRVPGWLCQKSVTVQVETGEGIEGAGYHGNA